MSPEEAFRQYLDSLPERALRAETEKLSALYETLAADADVMRLLCFIQLGYAEEIHAEVPDQARLEAHARGWRRDRRPVGPDEDLTARIGGGPLHQRQGDLRTVRVPVGQRNLSRGALGAGRGRAGHPVEHWGGGVVRIGTGRCHGTCPGGEWRDTASVTVLTARPRRRRRVLFSFRKSFSGRDSSRASPGSLQTSRPSPLQGNQNSMHPPHDKPCPKWIVWPPCGPAPRQDRLCGGTSAWCCGGRWWLWSARRSPSPSRRPGAKSSSVSRHRCRRT